MSALRECPFCASPLVAMRSSGAQGIHWAKCSACDADGPVCDTKAQALAAWNRRAGDDEIATLRAELAAAREAIRTALAMPIPPGKHTTTGGVVFMPLLAIASLRAALGDTP